MRFKPVVALLADLSATKSHIRPHVFADNPYLESQFNNMKNHNDSPARFGCLKHAGAYCRTFFAWYNLEHRHSDIGYMTPHSVRYGHAQALSNSRATTVQAVFLAAPNRFKGRCPQPPTPTESSPVMVSTLHCLSINTD